MNKANKRGRPVGTSTAKPKVGTLGEMLWTARRNSGLGLKDVSKKLKLSVQFISHIEQGRAPLPAKYVVRIAKVLNLSQNTLAMLGSQHASREYLKLIRNVDESEFTNEESK